MSYNAITGMVKAHAKATTVCFPSPKSVRSTVPDLEMLAMAIGWGVIQRSPPKCPLEGIDLQAFNDFMEEAHLPLVQDGDIALLCLTLPSVRSGSWMLSSKSRVLPGVLLSCCCLLNRVLHWCSRSLCGWYFMVGCQLKRSNLSYFYPCDGYRDIEVSQV